MKPKTFTLRNANGMTLTASNLGGIVTELKAPDKNGKFEDVVLCFDKVEDYHKNGYVNAIIGRVGNRINGGSFVIDGKKVALHKNDKANSLHGGKIGFDQKIWDARTLETPEGPALELTLLSPDGDEGYPGNLFVRVVYTLMDCFAWRLQYWAMTDAPTVFNPTNHAYFNLSAGKRDVLGHSLELGCSRFTPSDKNLIPTGEVLPVAGTPLDFTSPSTIGDLMKKKSPYLRKGFDNNFIIDRVESGLTLCAAVEDPESGRRMECWTTEPCVQLYTANNMVAGLKGKRGVEYGPYSGICLETQHVPDAPNQSCFKSIRLNPGEVFQSTTIYQFSVI